MAKVPQRRQDWIDARRGHQLSHAHVQMARELGLNPKKLGKLDNHDQEPWKAPLPAFIERLYRKRFGRARPEVVRSIEDSARAQQARQAARKAAKRERVQGGDPGANSEGRNTDVVATALDPVRTRG